MPRIQTIYRRSVLLGLGRCAVPPRCAGAFEMINPTPYDMYMMRVALSADLGDDVSCSLQVGDNRPIVDVSGRMLADRCLGEPLTQHARTPVLKGNERLTLLVKSLNQLQSLHVQPSVLLMVQVDADEPDPVWKVEFPKILYGVQLPPTFKSATEPAAPDAQPWPSRAIGGVFG